MREREVRACRAACLKEFKRAFVETERGSARGERENLDIVPRDAAAPTRAESLQRGLFGGKARGVMLPAAALAARVAISALGVREDALAEARRAPQRFTNAPDFDNVYADGDNHN